MNVVWQKKKQSFNETLEEMERRSPYLSVLQTADQLDEFRCVVMFDTKTLVSTSDGTVKQSGPVVVGIRYERRFLSEAPHPAEIVTILSPNRIFHPNALPTGALCLGHPMPGISMATVLHLAWSALTFNMRSVNTTYGQILNPHAAAYVRARADRFPLVEKGLFEE